MIVVSICLSDIPKEAITVSKTNGKKYLSVVVDERKEADNFGNTHSVALNQTKEQREVREKKVYLGNGKEYTFGAKEKAKAADYVQLYDNSDLPF